MNKLDKPIAIIGEVLFDQFPDGRRILGGAPFNVAWHLNAFGGNAYFISRVGDDALGDEIRQAMLAWGMPVDNLQTDPTYPTGIVDVTFTDGEPSYTILDNQAYDFIAAGQLNFIGQNSILYHGSLALRHETTEATMRNLAVNAKKIFIDVNLRQPWWNIGQVGKWLNAADWLKVNADELDVLIAGQAGLKDKMQRLFSQYQLEVLVVTRGNEGAIALDKSGEFIDVEPAQNIAVVDTVGAGDAFAAVLLLGILRGWDLSLTMARAQEFASALVQKPGATVQDRGFYQPFRAAWKI